MNGTSQRVLVTGGGGFLGSHLCRRLLADGASVVCLDNFYTGHESNIRPLLDDPGFELLRQDVTDPFDLAVDRIYSLACPAAPGHYQHDRIRTLRTSVIGTMNVLDLACATGARVLQASTSEVYGNPTEHPQRESYWGSVNPIGPRACYDEGKRVAETLMIDHHRQLDVDVRIARIFNTYGPNMHPYDGRVVSNFIRQALSGGPISIYGDGLQTRSFCYVDDLIDGLVSMMEGPDDLHGPVNIGYPVEHTVRELADLVLARTGCEAGIEFCGPAADDPARRCPDITLARDRLGWNPEVDLATGLDRTIAWFRSIDLSDWSPPTPDWNVPAGVDHQ